MKILHAFVFFSIKHAGGTSDLMYKIAKAQKKAGLSPVILSGDYKFDHDLAGSLAGVDFVICKSYFDKLGFSIMPSMIWKLFALRKDIDVVHMHVYRTFQNVILYFFCKLFSIPYVMDAHGAVPYHENKKITKRLFDLVIGKRILKNAKHLVSETVVGREEYTALMPSLVADEIVVLSPPFDTDEFLTLPEPNLFRKQYGIDPTLKVVMFLGRIHYIKGNDFLIRGFAEALKLRKDLFLVLVGPDDGHMVECKRIVEELGISANVLFTGFLGGEHKNSALVDADIVVQLSRFEQGAWAPLEGVLCKTPIIVTSSTGTGEDVKRLKAGYLVDFDNNEMLAATIIKIIENPDEAQELTNSARDFIIKNLSMNARVGEYTSLYL
jgi:glycosyltransferase involved in cell wall biosynthesis